MNWLEGWKRIQIAVTIVYWLYGTEIAGVMASRTGSAVEGLGNVGITAFFFLLWATSFSGCSSSPSSGSGKDLSTRSAKLETPRTRPSEQPQ